MKVSIIVPVYNIEESMLCRCLDSLVSQTLSEIEVLLIDDGSEAWCAAVCDRYACDHSGISVIHTDNQGVSSARNTGIQHAKGKYLMFVDADDWLGEDTAAQYYAYAQVHQLDILLSGCTIVNGEKYTASFASENTLFTPQTKIDLQLAILDNNPKYFQMWPMSPWAKLFRAEFVRKNNLSFTLGIKRMQDNLFCLQALEVTDRVGYFAYAGYYYRQTANSVCHKFNQNYRQIFEAALAQFKKFAESSSAAPRFIRAYYVKGIIILITEYTQLYYLHPENTKSQTDLRREYRHMCRNEPYSEIIKKVRIRDCHCAYRVFCFVLKKGWFHIFWFLLFLQEAKTHQY